MSWFASRRSFICEYQSSIVVDVVSEVLRHIGRNVRIGKDVKIWL